MNTARYHLDDATRLSPPSVTDEPRGGDLGLAEFDGFVAALRDARVLPPAILAAAVEDCEATADDGLAPATRLRRYLLDNGLATSSQLTRLADGTLAGVHVGPYRLLRPLGSGGTSRVYLAEHAQVLHRVALKLLAGAAADEPAVQRRFLREAHVFLSLDHPGIVRAFHFDESHGRPYLALEFVEGEDLRQRSARGPLPCLLVASYVAQAAGALAYLHGRGYVHRDVKPANLVVGKDQRVKLIDLGLVGGGPPGHACFGSDDVGAAGGSIDFIAPEQITRFHKVDSRADLYALGATLHTLLTGAPPFPGGTATEKFQRHLKHAPTPLESLRPDVPRFLAELCRRLMAKNPDDRPSSAGEVHDRVLAWLRRGSAARVGRSHASAAVEESAEPAVAVA